MTHTYHISGITCTGCQAKTKSLLSQIEGVQNVEVEYPSGDITIQMSKHIDTPTLQAAFVNNPQYQISENTLQSTAKKDFVNEKSESKSWLETYKPILLIFAYISVVSAIISFTNSGFNTMLFMQVFMGGFFLYFPFSKCSIWLVLLIAMPCMMLWQKK